MNGHAAGGEFGQQRGDGGRRLFRRMQVDGPSEILAKLPVPDLPLRMRANRSEAERDQTEREFLREAARAIRRGERAGEDQVVVTVNEDAD